MSIASLVSSVYSGATTARKEVEAALARAKAAEEYNAILNLTEPRALERADKIDERIKKGENVGPLAGVPFVGREIGRAHV